MGRGSEEEVGDVNEKWYKGRMRGCFAVSVP